MQIIYELMFAKDWWRLVCACSQNPEVIEYRKNRISKIIEYRNRKIIMFSKSNKNISCFFPLFFKFVLHTFLLSEFHFFDEDLMTVFARR